MKKSVLILLAGLIFVMCVSGSTVSAIESADAGTTYTFNGGNWVNNDSWTPTPTTAGGPGEDDSVVIPSDLTATAPDKCSVATITVLGTLNTGIELRVNSMTIERGGALQSVKRDAEIRSTGTLTVKGKLTAGNDLDIIAGKIICSGEVEGDSNLNLLSMDGFDISGGVTASDLLMIRCHQLTNDSRIECETGDIAIFSNTGITNNGTIKAGDAITVKGGDVLIACHSFNGNGVITAGNGADGNPPGRAGHTLIGRSFNGTQWSNETPSSPTGDPPDDLSYWTSQISKNPAIDGKVIAISENVLSLDIPEDVRPMAGLSGYSYICGIGGGTIQTKLNWNGAGTAKVRGSISHGELGSVIEYVPSGGSSYVRIHIPRSESSGRNIKTISVRYSVNGTNYATRLKLYVFYCPCPIIRGQVGDTTCTIEDDDGSISGSQMPCKPFIEGDRLMVPLRFIIESCDGSVSWDCVAKTATITMPGRTATFTQHSNGTMVNGYAESLLRDSRIVDGHMMVSARSLAGIIGADVEYEAGEYKFTYPGG
jgi:hypothetical protein